MSKTPDATQPTENVVDVPEGLSEDEAVEFIRKAIRDQGGDPDTAYLIAVDPGVPFTVVPEGNTTLTEMDLFNMSPEWQSLYRDLTVAYLDSQSDGKDDE